MQGCAECRQECPTPTHCLQHDTLQGFLTHALFTLPTEQVIRAAFETLIARLNVTPHIVAEFNDMAMVRLLTGKDFGVAFAPSVLLA